MKRKQQVTELHTIDECIEAAKKQVKDWYSPNSIREFIETNCNYFDGKTSEKFPRLRVFALQGGEPKGFFIVNYYDRSVIAFDFGCHNMKIWRLADSGWAYDERELDLSRKEDERYKL
jgi:hypothetical protein